MKSVETKTDIQIRHYNPKDYPTLRAWWKIHDAERLHETMIPPSSVIVEDAKGMAAFAAVYLCNSNFVAFCHGLVTRPGLNLGDSMMIHEVLQDGIDIIMREGGHKILISSVCGEAMIRGAKRLGFQTKGVECTQISRLVSPI